MELFVLCWAMNILKLFIAIVNALTVRKSYFICDCRAVHVSIIVAQNGAKWTRSKMDWQKLFNSILTLRLRGYFPERTYQVSSEKMLLGRNKNAPQKIESELRINL